MGSPDAGSRIVSALIFYGCLYVEQFLGGDKAKIDERQEENQGRALDLVVGGYFRGFLGAEVASWRFLVIFILLAFTSVSSLSSD